MKESNLKHKNTLKFGHSDDETTKKTGDTGSKRKESLRTRKSSTRVKPTKQTTRQFINLLLESSSEISNIYRKVERSTKERYYPLLSSLTIIPTSSGERFLRKKRCPCANLWQKHVRSMQSINFIAVCCYEIAC